MNDERDELDAFLDAGRARYGGVALAGAIDDAVTWAESRAARRRRVARAWIAGGVLAGLLGGGTAVATAMGDGSGPATISNSIMLSYASEGGAICSVEIQPVVQSADPAAWAITRTYLSSVDAPPVNLDALVSGGVAGEREVAALTDALSRGAESEIQHRLGVRAAVVLMSEYSCSPAPIAGDDFTVTVPIVGDDFGREPTQQGGRAPDAVGFFRASTGQICEIQMKVDPDWASGASEGDGALAARAFLATVNFTEVDFSRELEQAIADGWLERTGAAEGEAFALSRAVIEQMRATLSPPGSDPLPISIQTSSQCDPEPSE